MSKLTNDPSNNQLALDVGDYEVEQANARIARFINASISKNTRRGYRADLEHFSSWCSKKGLSALPAGPWTVANYLSVLAESGNYKVSTLERRATAIRQAHKLSGKPNPFTDYEDKSQQLKRFMRGLARELGRSPEKKTAARVGQLRKMVLRLDDDLEVRLMRDRAILLVGFLGAFRRSELVSLNVEDIEWWAGKGVSVNLRASKTDQEQKGRVIGLPYQHVPGLCAVTALDAWLDASCTTKGPIFRAIDRWGNIACEALSGKAVALIVKKAAVAAGLDPKEFSGHSLRAGLATSAAEAGKNERDIQAQTGHKSREMLREYIHRGGLFRDNAASGLFGYDDDGFSRMYQWFVDEFVEPRGVVELADGCWLWPAGEPYQARSVLVGKFGDNYPTHIIDDVIDVVEHRATKWARRIR